MLIKMPVKRQLKKETTLGQLYALAIATNKSIELTYEWDGESYPVERKAYAVMECEVEV